MSLPLHSSDEGPWCKALQALPIGLLFELILLKGKAANQHFNSEL